MNIINAKETLRPMSYIEVTSIYSSEAKETGWFSESADSIYYNMCSTVKIVYL